VMIELCQTAPAFRSLIGTTVGIGSQVILMDGTPEQKDRCLPRLALTCDAEFWRRRFSHTSGKRLVRIQR